jgi:hypothetical protein
LSAARRNQGALRVHGQHAHDAKREEKCERARYADRRQAITGGQSEERGERPRERTTGGYARAPVLLCKQNATRILALSGARIDLRRVGERLRRKPLAP